MHRINWAIIALIAANVAWGAGSPVMKFTLEQVPPFSLAFLRFLIACLLFYPFVHKQIDYPDLKNRWLWIFSLSGITFNIIFFFWALEKTASINAPIIGSFGPVMILIFSAIFLKEKIKKSAIIGLIMSLIGVIVIIFQPVLSKKFDGEIFGNFLLILATMGAVVSIVSGRKFLTTKNSFGSTFWSFFIGMVSFLPFMIVEYGKDPGWIANTSISGWVGVLYGGLFSSALAYAASNWALAKLPAYRVSIFAYIDPIAAILVAIPLLGEKVTIPFVIGSIMVFLGILIAEKRIHYHPLHKILNKANQ